MDPETPLGVEALPVNPESPLGVEALSSIKVSGPVDALLTSWAFARRKLRVTVAFNVGNAYSISWNEVCARRIWRRPRGLHLSCLREMHVASRACERADARD